MKLPTLLLCSLSPVVFAAEEISVTPTLESVGLFKNGLAVVRASFPVSGPGTYRWDKIPQVVHGSFWVESDGTMTVQSSTRMIAKTETSEIPSGILQQDLAGKSVNATLKHTDSPGPTFHGKVWEIPSPTTPKSWNTNYSSLSPNNGSYYWYRNQRSSTLGVLPGPPNGENFLILEEESGNRRYIKQSSIASLSVTGPFGPATRSEERPVLLFHIKKAPADGAAVRVTYLTKGLAWMPSYQVDLSDPKSLKIRQSAVIRNEMDDLADTRIELISGYPNVRFGAVDSPLWPGTGLASFFQQVNQSGSSSAGILSNSIMSQQMVYMNNPNRNGPAPLPDVAEIGNISDDIHYEGIGPQTMKAGDSLSLDIASSTATYERVVEWVVPDPRDERGRYHRQNNSNPARDDSPWDAVQFINPFKFPMTTASAMVVENGKFRGQSLSEWVNPGQQTSLRITRALSVRTESTETEEEGKRETVWIGGNDYQRTTVKGLLTLQNFRGKEVTMTIRCEFSGKLLEAEGSPEKSLRVEGSVSVNPRRQLDWTLKLAAGEEKVLNYRYQVLVDR